MDIKTVGIAGLGLLGRGIAACLLGHGFRVIAFTRREETHEEARKYIARAIDDLIDRAGFPEGLREEWSERYEPVTDLTEMAGCEFVIESVIEDIEVKQEIFDQFESLVRVRRCDREQYVGLAYFSSSAWSEAPRAVSGNALGRAGSCDTISRDHSWRTDLRRSPSDRRRIGEGDWQGTVDGREGRARVHCQSDWLRHVS